MKRILFIVGLLFLPALVMAADGPSAVTTFIDVLMNLLKGKIGWIFIGIILGFGAFFSWRNGNLTPLLWSLVAAFIIGAAPYVGANITSWANTTFGS